MLKALLVIWVIAMCQPASAETRVYGPDADGDSVVLTDDDCTLQITGAPVRLMHATLTNERGTYAGCWAMANDGVRILWEPAAEAKGWRVNPSLFRKVSML